MRSFLNKINKSYQKEDPKAFEFKVIYQFLLIFTLLMF